MFCGNCGKDMGENSKFCPYCGKKVIKGGDGVYYMGEGAEDDSYDSVPKIRDREFDKKSANIVTTIAVAVAVIAVVSLCFVLFRPKGQKNDNTLDKKETTAVAKNDDISETTEPTATPTSEPTETPDSGYIDEEADMPEEESGNYSYSPEDNLQNYVYCFVNAVNTGDYSDAKYCMQIGSNIYETQKKVSQNLYEKGVEESIQSCQTTNVKWLDSYTAEVTSYEKIRVLYSDGTQKTVKQSYIYTCVENNGAYLFTDMRSTKESSRKRRQTSNDLANDSEFILPEVATRYYTKREIKKLSKAQMRLARNEIYARHGYIFSDQNLSNYFLSKSWYVPTKTDVGDAEFNTYELKNLRLIQKCEK